MEIYGDAKSGNCYKLKLLYALLSIDYDWITRIQGLQGYVGMDD